MEITWYGHAAFRIDMAGLRIILDPYRSPESGGYAPVDDGADVVLVSHDNDTYHSHTGQIRPPFRLVRALDVPPGGLDLGHGVVVTSHTVFESPEKIAGDEVAIVVIDAEGRKLVFLGDLGHPLTDAEAEPLRGADVVLVPAGGRPTIDLPEIPALLDQIAPKVVVPMHYLTPKINLKIRPVEDLLALLPDWPVERVAGPSWTVGADDRRLVLLEFSR